MTASGNRTEAVVGDQHFRIRRRIQLQKTHRRAHEVVLREGPRAVLWTGEQEWLDVTEQLCGSSIPGLPRFLTRTDPGDELSRGIFGPLSDSTGPFDDRYWRALEHDVAIEALIDYARMLGTLHEMRLTLHGVQRGELYFDYARDRFVVAALPRLRGVERFDAETTWRDMRLAAELLYENFMDADHPGGHRMAAILQDRAAVAETGLTYPGLTQVLSGCVSPYGDIAYLDTHDLIVGLRNLADEWQPRLVVNVGARSTLGNYIFRRNNQDACGHLTVTATAGSRQHTLGFYCVADGIGGIQDGERASALAVETACTAFTRAWTQYGVDALSQHPVDFARAIARVTGQRLVLQGEFDPDRNRGGTTFTGLLLAGRRLGVCHVGDSRATLVRDGTLYQLTEDHTLRNMLVKLGELGIDEPGDEMSQRAISCFLSTSGETEMRRIADFDPTLADALQTEADTLHHRGIAIRPGDLLILTSDGAHGEYDAARLRQLVHLHARSPQMLAEALVDEALGAIGRDNATALVIRIDTRR